MRMRRLVWVAIVVFGGGITALMVASLLLHRAAGTAASGDLKTAVTGLREALSRWDYEDVTRHTTDIPRQAYQQMFDDANGGDPVRRSHFEGLLSSMDTFPSVRFTDVRPERVDVSYEVSDGTSATKPVTSFVPHEGAYFLHAARFPVASTAPSSGVEIVFHEGDNLPLDAAVEKLFDTLTTGSVDEFRTLMTMKEETPAREVTKRLDQLRALVMTCRDARIRKMIPRVGPPPRGTRWFRILVAAEVDEKRLWLEMTVIPGTPVRFGDFKAGLIKGPVVPEPPPASPTPAPTSPGPTG